MLSDEALAVTVMAPPRQAEATVEAIYNTPPDVADLTAQLAIIAAVHDCLAPALTISEVGNLDWLQKVAMDFPPITVGAWTIHGAAHRHSVTNRRLTLQIDSSAAFGTGQHPTTHGCLQLMGAEIKRRRQGRDTRLLDIGCGSGILAMAYAKATHGHAIGVEIDPEAARVARHNVRINGLNNHVRVVLGNGCRSPEVRRGGGNYDLIVANIFARPLCEIVPDIRALLKKKGRVILSGILHHQANAVISAYRQQGIRSRARIT